MERVRAIFLDAQKESDAAHSRTKKREMHPGGKSSQGGAFSALRALDMFPKVQEDFFQKTTSGGVITLAAYTIMALLFLSEFRESVFWRAAAAALLRAAAAAAARSSAREGVGSQACTPHTNQLTHKTSKQRCCRQKNPGPPKKQTKQKGLWLKPTPIHALSVDTSRGETIAIHVCCRLV